MCEELIKELLDADYALNYWDPANVQACRETSLFQEKKNEIKLLRANKVYKPGKNDKYFLLKITKGLQFVSYEPKNNFSVDDRDWPIFQEKTEPLSQVRKWTCGHLYELGDPYCPVCDVFHRYVYELKEEE